ncbi:MAG: TetR/AcrR family transcriptional regulator [Solirubrobacterales bacterium]
MAAADATLSRSEKQARTRSSLLAAASSLFAERGLEGASIDDVAAEAGYTKGAFYANFSSKEELFLAILEQKFSAELERLDAQLAGGEPIGDQARDAADDFISFVHSDPEWPRLYFEFAAHATRDEAFAREFAARQRALRDRIAELFRRRAKELAMEPPLPFGEIAAMTYFMADGFLLDQLIDPAIDDELYSKMLSIFIRGLQAEAAD